MNRWHYTSNIHDYIYIGDYKFRLNTAYDNVFLLFRVIKDNAEQNNLDTYLSVMFFKDDHAKMRELTKDWELRDYLSLIDYINKNILHLNDKKQETRKYADLDLDSELIFASFYFDYGISLVEKKGKMTWKEFLILFENLSDESPFRKAVKLCRTKSKDLTAEGRVQKMKRLSMLNSQEENLDKQADKLASFLRNKGKKQESKKETPKD